MNPRRTHGGRLGTAVVAVAAVLGLAACGAGGSAGANGEVNVVGFAVVKSAYDALGESFAETAAGQGVDVKGSYGPSGAQSRAVIAGQKADLVVFSVEPDLTAVAEAGKVAPTWADGANKGIVSRSVVVLAVRKGNPKGITGWDDLIKPGVQIVTADPGTSGAAKWNVLGAYSHGLGATDDEAAGQRFLGAFVKNVVSWAESGRVATETFVGGTGDVLISYENEAIAARAADVELDYIVPDSTLLIENPGAVTTTAPAVAKSFLDYVISADGQKVLGSKGFRPIDDSLTITGVEGANDPADPFPAIKDLTTIKDLGGWSDVNTEFFDKENGIVTKLRAG